MTVSCQIDHFYSFWGWRLNKRLESRFQRIFKIDKSRHPNCTLFDVRILDYGLSKIQIHHKDYLPAWIWQALNYQRHEIQHFSDQGFTYRGPSAGFIFPTICFYLVQYWLKIGMLVGPIFSKLLVWSGSRQGSTYQNRLVLELWKMRTTPRQHRTIFQKAWRGSLVPDFFVSRCYLVVCEPTGSGHYRS